MAFNNTAPLAYAAGEVVAYVDARRGVSESAAGPSLTVTGLYSPRSNNLFDPDFASNTAILTNVAATVNSAILLVANTSRQGAVIVNEASATLYIAYAANANSTNYTYALYSGGVWEMPRLRYTGPISGALAANSGPVRITSLH